MKLLSLNFFLNPRFMRGFFMPLLAVNKVLSQGLLMMSYSPFARLILFFGFIFAAGLTIIADNSLNSALTFYASFDNLELSDFIFCIFSSEIGTYAFVRVFFETID